MPLQLTLVPHTPRVSTKARLPAVGARGSRWLDDVVFACVVTAVDADTEELTIQYDDDGHVESGLALLEFLQATCNDDHQENQHEQQTRRVDCSQQLIQQELQQRDDSMCSWQDTAVLVRIAAFLDHFVWIQRLALVSKRWRHQFMQQQYWHTVRVPRVITVSRHVLSRSATHAEGVLGPTAYVAAITNLLLRTRVFSCNKEDGEKMAIRDDEPALSSTSVADAKTSESALSDSTANSHAVCQVVQELVLSDCPVSDDSVLQLIEHCSSSLQRLVLQRCSQISFLLLYELTRRAKSASGLHLKHVDVSLCRGVSPAYMSQLRANGVFERTGMRVTGPGFAISDVSTSSWRWIEHSASHTLEDTTRAISNQHEDARVAELAFDHLVVRFVPKTTLATLFETEHHEDNGPRRAKQELTRLRDAVEALTLPVAPFVRLDYRVFGRARATDATRASEPHSSEHALVGVPATPDDLLRLVEQYEDVHVAIQLSATFASLTEAHTLASPAESGVSDTTEMAGLSDAPLSLDARAEQVFAMLRETTRGLEAHVAHLEQQVQRMTAAKDAAQREYLSAQMELDRVAKEADRALLSLATSSDALPPPPPSHHTLAMSSSSGDELLSPLPSDARLRALGEALETSSFTLLDGFLGDALSGQVRSDLEQLYLRSRTTEAGAPTHTTSFTLGELAGGKTGRNTRYKMAHVRGDYMLWLDEHDACCPVSVQQALRQLDRLVLERLPQWNSELQASALLRKKAMATCYPGNGARYTKHCDNPNKNGRKARTLERGLCMVSVVYESSLCAVLMRNGALCS